MTSVFISFTSFLSSISTRTQCLRNTRQSVQQDDFRVEKSLHLPGQIHSVHRRRRLENSPRYHFACCQENSHLEKRTTYQTDTDTPPCNVGCTANTTESGIRFVPAGCSQVMPLCSLLPSCIVRRLSESRWCKGSCPVLCICRLIAPYFSRIS